MARSGSPSRPPAGSVVGIRPRTRSPKCRDSWGKHTIRITPDGMVWSTGGLSRFDPKSGTFTHIPEVPNVYGIAVDPQSNILVRGEHQGRKFGKVDAKTLQVTKYVTPTTQRPRRIQVDSDGMVWFAGPTAGRSRASIPRRRRSRSLRCRAACHALRARHRYRAQNLVLIGLAGRARPARSDTGTVIEYPMPFLENGMRDFFLDAEGHVWFGSPANNKVGYFYCHDQPRPQGNASACPALCRASTPSLPSRAKAGWPGQARP